MVEVLIQVFELSVCNFEIYNELFVTTVHTSLPMNINEADILVPVPQNHD